MRKMGIDVAKGIVKKESPLITKTLNIFEEELIPKPE